MDLQDAYKILQDNCGIEVGDKVKVLHKTANEELGWGYCWVSEMDACVGRELTVVNVKTGGICLEDRHYYPWFVLELVEKAPKTKIITIDGKDIEISIESFNELKKKLAED